MVDRVQIGIRVSVEAVKRIDLLAEEYGATRADVVRVLLSEAIASQEIVNAARKRLGKAI